MTRCSSQLVASYITPYIRAFHLIRAVYPALPRHLVLCSIVMIGVSLLAASVPVFLSVVVDRMAVHGVRDVGSWFPIYLLALAYGMAWTLSNIMEWSKGLVSAFILVRCDAAVAESFFRQIIRWPYARQRTLDLGQTVAEIRRSMSSFGQINQAIFWTILPVAVQLVIVFGVIWARLDVVLATMFLMSMAVLFALAVWIALRSKDVHASLFSIQNKLASRLTERLATYYDIKINAAYREEEAGLHAVLSQHKRDIMAANVRMASLMAVQIGAIGLILVVTLTYAVYRSEAGAYTAGDFVMVATYLVQLTMPFALIASSLMQLRGHYLAMSTWFQYLDVEPEPVRTAVPWQDTSQKTLFEFKDVSLSLDGVSVLRHATFTIPRGQVVAIMGQSGTGKSTLVNVMLGLQPVDQGTVRFCGHFVYAPPFADPLSQMAVAPQHPTVHRGTLRDNLLYGLQRAPSDQALRKVLADLELEALADANEDGLDAPVGEGTRALSGGEKQRLAIARALLKGCRTLILDEPTSSIDLAQEARVLKRIRAYVDTMIMVSHRSAVLDMADTVVTLDDGATIRIHPVSLPSAQAAGFATD